MTGLQGVRIIDLGRFQAGPRSAMVLGDFGAEVIKVEAVGGEDMRRSGPFVEGHSITFAMYNRGKKSITLNLADPRAHSLFLGLVRCSDVVIENFIPGTLEKFGIGWATLRRVNPSLILVSVSGFGQEGSSRREPALDPMLQARAGIAHVTGEVVGRPILTMAPIVDRSGAFHAAVGALVALWERNITGLGKHVDVALYDCAIALLEKEISDTHHMGRSIFKRWASPLQCRDGWVVVQAIRQGHWERIFAAIGRSDLAANPAYTSYAEGKGEVRPRLEALREWARDRSAEEVLATAYKADVPCAKCQTLEEVIRDPYMVERQPMAEVDVGDGHPMLVPGPPARMEGLTWRPQRAPKAGEHNSEILQGLLGLSEDEMQELLHVRAV
ncbi:MAG: CoA transferase [Chloroflexi bacterium]|nr:CoA transferase [Chloroflexota bacterium]